MEQAARNREEIALIKYRLRAGLLTYSQAKLMAQPLLDEINELTAKKTSELNKKYGMNQKPHKLDFVSAMRNSY